MKIQERKSAEDVADLAAHVTPMSATLAAVAHGHLWSLMKATGVWEEVSFEVKAMIRSVKQCDHLYMIFMGGDI